MNHLKPVLLIILTLLSLIYPSTSTGADGWDQNLLTGTPPPHPRLYLSDNALTVLKERIQKQPRFSTVWQKIKLQADKALNYNFHPAVSYDPDQQHQHSETLQMMRGFMERSLSLSLAYRITAEERYLRGAIRELDRILALERWGDPGPLKYDLCTGEISATIGIVYDWLYNYLTPAQRLAILNAARTKSFQLYLNDNNTGKGMLFAVHNHNAVDNGGAFVLAVSLWGESDLAPKIATYALQNIRIFLDHLPADGGYPEGSGYWGYAFMYLGYLLGAGEAVPSFNLCGEYPVLSKVGYFPIYMTTGFAKAVDFCDSGQGPQAIASLNLLASYYSEPCFAKYQEDFGGKGRDLALQLIWLLPEAPISSDLSNNKYFPELGWASFRTGWGRNDLFLAVKGGANTANHSHLDLGSFALGYGGQWYTTNPQSLYSKAYFNRKKRWGFYAASTAGQNAVIINGLNQDPNASAALVDFNETPEKASVTVDLTRAWGEQVRSYHRIFTIFNKGLVRITDEIEADRPINCDWQMHTPFSPVLSGKEARFLNKSGLGILLTVKQPNRANLKLIKVQNGAEELQKLVVSQTGTKIQFIVEMAPIQ